MKLLVALGGGGDGRELTEASAVIDAPFLDLRAGSTRVWSS